MSQHTDEVITLSNGAVVLWADPGAAVHLKCVTRQGDPVELNAEAVKELCAILQRLVRDIE